jgi:hypothetical protein
MTVPKRRNAPGLSFAGQGIVYGANDLGWIGTHKQVGSLSDGDRPLGVLPKRQAWNA